MKIAVFGYSGSGKSTLAKLLGNRYGLPVLYIDTIQFLSDWLERDKTERLALMKEFLDTHDSWVIDGNYTSVMFKERMAAADRIIFLAFSRFSCLLRVIKRYRKNKNHSRESMASGCNEKLDLEFIYWVLIKGRSRKRRQAFYETIRLYKDKTTVIRNQRELNKFISEFSGEHIFN